MFDKLGGMFQQAKEMQSKIGEMQDTLRQQQVEVSTGGGMVKVVANGLNEILSDIKLNTTDGSTVFIPESNTACSRSRTVRDSSLNWRSYIFSKVGKTHTF